MKKTPLIEGSLYTKEEEILKIIIIRWHITIELHWAFRHPWPKALLLCRHASIVAMLVGLMAARHSMLTSLLACTVSSRNSVMLVPRVWECATRAAAMHRKRSLMHRNTSMHHLLTTRHPPISIRYSSRLLMHSCSPMLMRSMMIVWLLSRQHSRVLVHLRHMILLHFILPWSMPLAEMMICHHLMMAVPLRVMSPRCMLLPVPDSSCLCFVCTTFTSQLMLSFHNCFDTYIKLLSVLILRKDQQELCRKEFNETKNVSCRLRH
jgi:hypothetical protein